MYFIVEIINVIIFKKMKTYMHFTKGVIEL